MNPRLASPHRAGALPVVAAHFRHSRACNNSPYPDGAAATNTLFYSFDERSPRYLDPTASYANPETAVHLPDLRAALRLPLPEAPVRAGAQGGRARSPSRTTSTRTASACPTTRPASRSPRASTTSRSSRGIMYAPHPAFAKDAQGRVPLSPPEAGPSSATSARRWTSSSRARASSSPTTSSTRSSATRRRASRRRSSRVFAEYVIGLKDYGELISAEDAEAARRACRPDQPRQALPRLPQVAARRAPTALDTHTLRIRLKGKYPQWKYWMAMTFIAPIPWEADAFYAQPGMAENSLTLNQWPVGTGPVHDDRVRPGPPPRDGAQPELPRRALSLRGRAAATRRRACSTTAARRMPFVDKLVVDIEKEKVPRKEKFLQGYFDVPEIERPDWGVDFRDDANDSDDVRKRRSRSAGFKLPADDRHRTTGTSASTGSTRWSARATRRSSRRRTASCARRCRSRSTGRRLRSRSSAARAAWPRTGPLPPRPVRLARRHARRRQPGDAQGRRTARPCAARSTRRRQLLAEAGYPDGRDAKTGKPLVLNYDYQRAPTPERKAELDWMVEPVRQDRRPARGARDRLQPVPGQDAQGQAPDLLVGLARRLPRRRELPVPALRAEREGEVRGREHRELPEPRVRQAVTAS